MQVRVTQQLLSATTLSNFNTVQNALFKTQQQITTGKKISKASENPLDATQIMKSNKELYKIGSYIKNINSANDELKLTDTTLDSMTSMLLEIQELAIQAATDTNDLQARLAIKAQVDAKMESLVALANTKYLDEYIFAGTNTETPPYVLTDNPPPGPPTGYTIEYHGTPAAGDWKRKTEISEGNNFSYNTNAQSVFGDENGGLFDTLIQLSNALAADSGDDIRNTLNGLQDGLKKILDARAVIGGGMNRLEMTLTAHQQAEITLKETKSGLEETDLIEAMTNLALQQTALEASLKAGSYMLGGPTLLNYI